MNEWMIEFINLWINKLLFRWYHTRFIQSLNYQLFNELFIFLQLIDIDWFIHSFIKSVPDLCYRYSYVVSAVSRVETPVAIKYHAVIIAVVAGVIVTIIALSICATCRQSRKNRRRRGQPHPHHHQQQQQQAESKHNSAVMNNSSSPEGAMLELAERTIRNCQVNILSFC